MPTLKAQVHLHRAESGRREAMYHKAPRGGQAPRGDCYNRPGHPSKSACLGQFQHLLPTQMLPQAVFMPAQPWCWTPREPRIRNDEQATRPPVHSWNQKKSTSSINCWARKDPTPKWLAEILKGKQNPPALRENIATYPPGRLQRLEKYFYWCWRDHSFVGSALQRVSIRDPPSEHSGYTYNRHTRCSSTTHWQLFAKRKFSSKGIWCFS